MALAEDMGLKVEKRPIPLSELSEMDEVAACGTAVVITPVTRLVLNDKVRPTHTTFVGNVLR